MTGRKEEHEGVSGRRLAALPRASGVYLMKSRSGEVLYVGKAKDLRARVSQYFTGADGRLSIPYLLPQVEAVDTLVTEDERQAIILEADLIKKYKPRYNVRLKDDKAYLLVRVDMNADWPRLELVRSAENDGAVYLGPYAFSYELRTLLEVVKRTVPLRTCTDHVLHNRVRPCLEYQIKRCSGPCCLEVDRNDYFAWIEQALTILKGHTGEVVDELTRDLKRASDELRFEDAASIRDRLQVLERIEADRKQVHFSMGATDAFGFYREGVKAELCVLMVRQGRLFESKTFGFEDVGGTSEEVLGSLMTQFYSGDVSIPEVIVVPLDLEDCRVREDWMSERRGAKTTIACAKRGDKARLLALAQRNAKQNFEARFSEFDRGDRLLSGLQHELKLEEAPRVVECVDVSHFQGMATVASVVSFKGAKPDKSRYRRFHLSQEGKPDDFASMREVLTRHLSRCAEENNMPDLIMVDGGPPQLVQALAARKELGLEAPVLVGMAKKRGMMKVRTSTKEPLKYQAKKPERVYVESRPLPIILPPDSEVLQLLERIRNEAHRFAITFHRSTRAKKAFRSALDGIAGVGPLRRLALLREFRTVEAIREAEPEEISERCRIPLALAQKISGHLRKHGTAQA